MTMQQAKLMAEIFCEHDFGCHFGLATLGKTDESDTEARNNLKDLEDLEKNAVLVARSGVDGFIRTRHMR
jgi:hypothetical protein